LFFYKDSLLHANPTVPPWAAESQQIFPGPPAQSFLINGLKNGVFARRATLVPAAPRWEASAPCEQASSNRTPSKRRELLANPRGSLWLDMADL